MTGLWKIQKYSVGIVSLIITYNKWRGWVFLCRSNKPQTSQADQERNQCSLHIQQQKVSHSSEAKLVLVFNYSFLQAEQWVCRFQVGKGKSYRDKHCFVPLFLLGCWNIVTVNIGCFIFSIQRYLLLFLLFFERQFSFSAWNT